MLLFYSFELETEVGNFY